MLKWDCFKWNSCREQTLFTGNQKITVVIMEGIQTCFVWIWWHSPSIAEQIAEAFSSPPPPENQRDSGCSAATLLLIVRSSENKQHQGCCGECSARNTNPRTIVLETCKQGPRSMLKNKAFTCKLVAAKHKHVAETPGLLKNVHNARKLSGNLKAKTEGFHTREKKMHGKDNGWHNILA